MRDFKRKEVLKVMRSEANPKIDREIFKRTASTGKAINIGRIHYRGGTRL